MQRSTPRTQANLTAAKHKTNTQLRHHKIKIKVPSLEALLVFEFPRVTEFRTCGLPRLWIRAFSRHQENRWKTSLFLTEISFFAFNKSQTHTHTQNDFFFVFHAECWLVTAVHNVLQRSSFQLSPSPGDWRMKEIGIFNGVPDYWKSTWAQFVASRKTSVFIGVE